MKKNLSKHMLLLALISVLTVPVYKYFQQQTIIVEHIELPRPTHALMAYKDPVTGKFTLPTQAQLAAQAEARKKRPKMNQVYKRQLPDGSSSVDLRAHYRSTGDR